MIASWGKDYVLLQLECNMSVCLCVWCVYVCVVLATLVATGSHGKAGRTNGCRRAETL